MSDLRYALRLLLANPGIALLAVFAVAIGIGSATAVFTVVDSVLLRPLPYADPERLIVALHGSSATGPVSPADYLDYQREAERVARLGAAQAWSATLTGGDRAERVQALRVTASLFDVLGVPALAGRTFAPDEDQPGRDRVVVLGHGIWQRRFAGDRSVVGRTIQINGEGYVVVGVMPSSFRFAPFWQTRAELWVPLTLAGRLEDRSGRSLRVFGRLKDDVTVVQAQAAMSAIAARLERTYSQTNAGMAITVQPLLDKVVSGVRGTLAALMAMVIFVLLIACANVSNVLLARAAGREREIALRAALGASPARIVRQLLAESLLLSLVGAVAGLVLAIWGVHALIAMLPPGSLPRQHEVGFDARVLGVAAAATMFAGVFAGLAPAMQLLKEGTSGVVRDGAKGASESRRTRRLRAVLVAAEMMLAIVLLVGAGLMGRTMLKLAAIEPGFTVNRTAVASVSLTGTVHDRPDARYPLFVRVRERLAAMPGIQSVSAINHLPLAGDIWKLGYWLEGQPEPAAAQRWSAVYRIVQPGYFATMGIPLLDGRDFWDHDGANGMPVAIVNRTMAERRWPGERPIGKRIYLPGPSDVRPPITVVGVAADTRQSDWTAAPEEEVYLAHAQRAGEFGLNTMTFVMRAQRDAGAIAASIGRTVSLMDAGLTVSDAMTMEAVVADELWRERLTAMLAGLFALVALGLAAIGLYGVVAHSVARRTREFGVRLALGASGASVQRLALTDAVYPVIVGGAAGLAASWPLGSFVRSLLFEVSPTDPLAASAAASTLLAVALLAAWVPARRASRVDPLEALRDA